MALLSFLPLAISRHSSIVVIAMRFNSSIHARNSLAGSSWCAFERILWTFIIYMYSKIFAPARVSRAMNNTSEGPGFIKRKGASADQCAGHGRVRAHLD